MKRVIASAITLLCVACGGSSDEPAIGTSDAPAARAAKHANEPPSIESAEVGPAEAGASSQLEVVVVARDPDRDNVRLDVEWYRNGVLAEELTDTTVPPETFARGDRVYAIVYASDGKLEVTRQTQTLFIGNSAPIVRRVAITPPRPTALDLLQGEPDVEDIDGDSVELRYRWLRNGQPIADADGPRIPPGVGHRAEQIVLQVQATDGTDESPWVGSTPIVLANAAPGITTQPNYELSGAGQYSYEVSAADPDGDRPLKYELVEGPPGMSVDVVSGRVTWRVPSDAKGVYPIELAVSDPYGGKTTQKYSLAVDWGTPAAKGAAAKGTAAKPVPPAASGSDVESDDGIGLDVDVDVSPGSAGDDAAERDEDYTDEDQGEEPTDDEF